MKQLCTSPYAPNSSPTFNSKAYPCQIDGGYSKPDYFVVWSPVHYPHYVGHYNTQEAAQRKADEINANKSEWIYLADNPVARDQWYAWYRKVTGKRA